MVLLNVLFVVGASAVAAPLPLIEPSATVPNIALYLHLPTMIVVVLVFVAVGSVAILLPSWRATMVDPVTVLQRG